MPVTTFKTGVTDTAAGAGVHEYLALSGGMAAMSQVTTPLPFGDLWQSKASGSFTPTLITDTLPPSPVMAWRVPTGKALLFTGGIVHSLAASIEYYRVCRRYFLFGYQATAVPAASVAPTVAQFAAQTGGSVGTYTYKAAPIDSFRREGVLSPASAAVSMATGFMAVTVTPPALPAGAIGWAIYRTLNGGVTWYFLGYTAGSTAYIDATTDALLNISPLIPSATWAIGNVNPQDVPDGPCELIIEVGTPALAGAPTHLVYRNAYDDRQLVHAVTFPTTVGARLRAKLSNEAANFIAVGTATANLTRGPFISADIRGRHEDEYGAIYVKGTNANATAGAFIVWGQQVIGVGQRGADPAAGTAHAYQILPTNPHGVLIPPDGEIVLEVGALAAGVVGVRDATLFGSLIPTTGT